MSTLSGPRLVGLLGVPLQDDRVVAALAELAAPDLDLEPGVAVAVDVGIPAAGLSIRFRPPLELRDGASFDVPAETLLTGILFFYGSNPAAEPFPGELPFGLSIGQTRAEVRAVLDQRVGPVGRGGPAWEFDGLTVRVDHTDDQPDDRQRIKLLTVGLVRSGQTARRPAGLPPRPDPATRALLRAIAAAPDLHPTRPVPAAPPEHAVLLRHAADPLLTERIWMDITETPDDLQAYLTGVKAEGTARFFRDIHWLGQRDNEHLYGYWSAETFDGAPLVSLDTEGCFTLEALTFVDWLADAFGDDSEELTGFLARTGLPAPTPPKDRASALAELPDPNRAYDAWLALDPSPWQPH